MDTNETKIYTAFLIAAIILGIFFIFFIVTIVRHQKKNLALYKEKLQVEINTLETERSRIASDLHDELGPMISTVKLLVNNVSLQSSAEEETMRKANQYIDSILHQVRTISNNLMPQALKRKGLQVAVEEFISEINDKGKMKIHFTCDALPDLPPESEIHLYRIIQEATHNAAKHASASQVEIGLYKMATGICLKLEDDGVGFDSKSVAVTFRGLGLHNITSRVETLKGTIFLDTGPGIGTKYSIEIPNS